MLSDQHLTPYAGFELFFELDANRDEMDFLAELSVFLRSLDLRFVYQGEGDLYIFRSETRPVQASDREHVEAMLSRCADLVWFNVAACSHELPRDLTHRQPRQGIVLMTIVPSRH